MLHTDKFKSGNIGECIQTGQEWMTPNKFEIRAGSKSRKYKTSIRSTRQGITLQEYIEKGYLVEQRITATAPARRSERQSASAARKLDK